MQFTLLLVRHYGQGYQTMYNAIKCTKTYKTCSYIQISTPNNCNWYAFLWMQERHSCPLRRLQRKMPIHRPRSNKKSSTRQTVTTDCCESVDEHDVEQFRKSIDDIENTYHLLFQSTFDDLKKFYSKFYGVTNLSELKLNINQLKVPGKVLKYCPTPPELDHGPLKEQIDKIFHSLSRFLFLNNEKTDDNLDTPQQLASNMRN